MSRQGVERRKAPRAWIAEAPEPGAEKGPAARIVAVIPAFNEERFIASVVLTARRYAVHVIVVDDGSTDRTVDLAIGSGAMVVRQPVNGGKAVALNAGFRLASSLNPDAIVCLDGDAQHEPAEIPMLARPILEREADVVIGSRFLAVRNEIPRWRQVGQHTLTLLTNSLSGTRVTDSQSGYRAFSPEAVKTLRFSTSGLGLESEMQFMFRSQGLRVVEVPISVRYLDGNKRNPVAHGIQVIDSMLSIVARRRPLMFVSLPGALFALVGLVLGAMVIFTMERTGSLMVGTALLTLLMVIGGLLLTVTGVLLHSIGGFVGTLRDEMLSALSSDDDADDGVADDGVADDGPGAVPG